MANFKTICPMMGGEECVGDGAQRNNELVKCRFWINVVGKNPQTSEDINSSDCAIAWIPVLLIENSRVNRETGAAVESFRNEASKSASHVNALMTGLLTVASHTQTLPNEKTTLITE